jgi:hypothetical protein
MDSMDGRILNLVLEYNTFERHSNHDSNLWLQLYCTYDRQKINEWCARLPRAGFHKFP